MRKAFYTVTETAEILGISRRKMQKITEEGEMDYYRIGSIIRISERQIMAFLKVREIAGTKDNKFRVNVEKDGDGGTKAEIFGFDEKPHAIDLGPGRELGMHWMVIPPEDVFLSRKGSQLYNNKFDGMVIDIGPVDGGAGSVYVTVNAGWILHAIMDTKAMLKGGMEIGDNVSAMFRSSDIKLYRSFEGVFG